MSKCTAAGCAAEITWAINLKTEKRVPLVPYDEKYPKAVRYSLRPRTDGQMECERDDAGGFMSHNANYKNPKLFAGRNK